jgi:hypothetical protein
MTMAAESESLQDIIAAVPPNASIVFDFENYTLKIGDKTLKLDDYWLVPIENRPNDDTWQPRPEPI